ncbi:MAG: ABC transporter permease [Christensenellales bacterium]
MEGAVALNLYQFALVYVLLLAVLLIMKKSKISQTKLLVVASLRMTVQLVLAGFILTYIFDNPHPLFTVLYLIAMTVFAVFRVLSKSKSINKKFKVAIAASLSGAGIAIVVFFVGVIVGMNIFNPRYTIPLSGMIIGNAMTGVTLGMKTFTENIKTQRSKIEALLNIGATPKKILLPFVNNALETALLPTMNSMLGMGIISLPGMMTGQILSGTVPTTAILYQIAIIISITTVVCLSVFSSLYFGYRTLYNKQNQII